MFCMANATAYCENSAFVSRFYFERSLKRMQKVSEEVISIEKEEKAAYVSFLYKHTF